MHYVTGLILLLKVALLIALWAPQEEPDPLPKTLRDPRGYVVVRSEHWAQNRVVNFDEIVSLPQGKAEYQYTLRERHGGWIYGPRRQFVASPRERYSFPFSNQMLDDFRVSCEM